MKKFLAVILSAVLILSSCFVSAAAYKKTEVDSEDYNREYIIYNRYVNEYLVPLYGCMDIYNISKTLSTDNIATSAGWAKRSGILGYDLADLNNDGIYEMLLYVFESDNDNNSLFCDCYTIGNLSDFNSVTRIAGRANVYEEKLGCTNYCLGGVIYKGEKPYFYFEKFYEDSHFSNVMYAEYDFYEIDEYGEFDKKYSVKQSSPGSDGFDYSLIEYSRIKNYEHGENRDSKSVQETMKQTKFWTKNSGYTIEYGIREMFADQLGFIVTSDTMGEMMSKFAYVTGDEFSYDENSNYICIYKNYNNIDSGNVPENFPSYEHYVYNSFTIVNASEDHAYQKSGEYNFVDIVNIENLYNRSGNGIYEGVRTYVYGDIDNDGKITSADSLLILRRSVGLEDFTLVQEEISDVDNDNSITSADALEVLRYSVSLPTNTNIGGLLYTS